MVRIGLLSDTHSYIDDSMLKFFESVDEIWHAGDIGNMEVLEKIRQVKNVRTVYGNIDNQTIRMEMPQYQVFTVEQVKVVMTHIGGYPGNYASGITKMILEHQPKLFVAGHSHILKVIYDKKYNCLHMNPGASGISGFHKVRTMLRFAISDDQIKDLEVWEKSRN
jgi:uncharacterized protein